MFESSDVEAYKRLEIYNRSEKILTISLAIAEVDSTKNNIVFEKQITLEPDQMEVFETDLELDKKYNVSVTTDGGPNGSGEVTMCDCILVVRINEGNVDISFSAY
ncbi:hypothetical protein [Haladaptatus sp. ZSTT2]|uniref:hypothetical protein n=1 Tax=Haladaptatus sp. ZSTT2 TaxID=3120515 RepID=UPI00300F300E